MSVTASTAQERFERRAREQAIVSDNEGLKSDYTGEGLVGVAAARKILKKKKPENKGLKAIKSNRQAMAKLLDDPDTPLTPELRKQYEGAVKSRKSIMEYKLKANKAKRTPILNYNMGVDMIGRKAGDRFVKETRADSVLKKYAKGKIKKQFKRLAPVAEDRKRVINRVLMQNQLEDLGTDTYFYRKRKGAPVTLSQEVVKPMANMHWQDPYYRPTSEIKDKIKLAAKKKGVRLMDMHDYNIGVDKDGKVKILDTGHSIIDDYEKTLTKPKLRKALQSRNVVSPQNKRLYQKMAKKWAKRLPMIGYGLTGLGVLLSSDRASAAEQALSDIATAGLIDNVGRAEITPEEVYRIEMQKRMNKGN